MPNKKSDLAVDPYISVRSIADFDIPFQSLIKTSSNVNHCKQLAPELISSIKSKLKQEDLIFIKPDNHHHIAQWRLYK